MSNDVKETQPLNTTTLIISRLNSIASDIRQLPVLLVRIDTLTESTRQLEIIFRETVSELRSHDEEQQKEIEDMRLRQSEIMAGLSALSSTMIENKQDMKDFISKFDAKFSEFNDEFNEWRPWLNGIKWGIAIIGGILVTSLTGALLWALVQSY